MTKKYLSPPIKAMYVSHDRRWMVTNHGYLLVQIATTDNTANTQSLARRSWKIHSTKWGLNTATTESQGETRRQPFFENTETLDICTFHSIWWDTWRVTHVAVTQFSVEIDKNGVV